MPARTTPLKRTRAKAGSVAARPIRDPKRRLAKVIDLLEAEFGRALWDGPKDALEVLVLTILSQNTTDPNALRGYQALAAKLPAPGTARKLAHLPRDSAGKVDRIKLRLSNAARAVSPPDWARVAALRPRALGNLIRTAGLPDSKSRAILAVLAWLKERTGGYRLEAAIESLGLNQTMAALVELKGIGVKTVSVTVIEAIGADLCPVDTHVHRIANRLGVVETGSNRDKTFRQLSSMIASGRAYSLHHNLLTFGRTICTARNPKCSECLLARLCPSKE